MEQSKKVHDCFNGYPRDCLGGGTVAGDLRWCGAYGVQADFIARSHCSVEVISTADIQVGSQRFSMTDWI
jgi:hypothetical protein